MRPGDEVICVDDSPPLKGAEHFKNWVKRDTMYTIRRAEGSLGNVKRILLEEVSNPPMNCPEIGGRVEPGFSHKRFTRLDGSVLEQSVEKEEEVLQ